MHGISAATGVEGHSMQRQCLLWGRGSMYAHSIKRYRRSTRNIFRKVLFKRNFMKFGNKEEGIGPNSNVGRIEHRMVAENYSLNLNS